MLIILQGCLGNWRERSQVFQELEIPLGRPSRRGTPTFRAQPKTLLKLLEMW